ncbi:hypothetical protein V1478_009780 [Vespula squamosa]|uniref:Uncharacterized protein n=1 Tax=Vespula squamosa TaxID=30214 RepID=A0ABD2AJD9_VESSQ
MALIFDCFIITQHPIFVKSRCTSSIYRVVRYKNVNSIYVD